MSGILRIAYKSLVNDRGKFAALIMGISFAVFLMIQMTSMFAGILNKSSSTVINIGARVWVMDPARSTLNSCGSGRTSWTPKPSCITPAPISGQRRRPYPERGLRTEQHLWSFGTNMTAPLFHGGTLWFQRKAAIEAFDVSLASYRQTVLGAFTQMADVLRALEHDAQTLRAQSEAVDSASQALKLLQANFQAGTADYLQILVAYTQYQQARLGYLQTQAQRLLDTTALFVAMCGGWWNSADLEAGIKPLDQ